MSEVPVSIGAAMPPADINASDDESMSEDDVEVNEQTTKELKQKAQRLRQQVILSQSNNVDF